MVAHNAALGPLATVVIEWHQSAPRHELLKVTQVDMETLKVYSAFTAAKQAYRT